MRQPKKWKRDHPILTYPDFETCVRAKSMIFVMGFFRERPTSAVVVANMSYSLVTWLILHARLNIAVQTEEYRDWLRDELLGEQPVQPEMFQNRFLLLQGEVEA